MSYGLLHRLSLSARSSVVAPAPSPVRVLRLVDVAPGWIVQDLIGRQVGHVVRVTEKALIIRRGWRRTRPIPSGHIAEARDGVVRLTDLASELR